MSKGALELLRVSGLLKADYALADLTRFQPDDLQGILHYYRTKREEMLQTELSRLAAEPLRRSSLLSSLSTRRSVPSLCPKLLVEEALIVNDPLFAFAAPRHELTRMQIQEWGIPGGEAIDLPDLARHLSYFSETAQLINEGLLHVLPLSLLHKPPEQLPVILPKDRYRELVPLGVRSYIVDSVIVRPMQFARNGGLQILNRPNNERRPQICITFENDQTQQANFYQYFTPTFTPKDDHTVEVAFPLVNDQPLDQAQYDVWVEQSVNKTVGLRLESIGKEMCLADLLGVTYMTESTFEAELLSRSGDPRVLSPARAINFLDANSTMLNLDDVDSVVRLRSKNGPLLERFRLSLENIAEELKGLEPGEYEDRARQLFETEVQPQIAEVNNAIRRMIESGAKGSLQTGVAVSLGLLTGSVLPAAALLTCFASGIVGEAIPAVGDYLALRHRPQFIWHQLAKPQGR